MFSRKPSVANLLRPLKAVQVWGWLLVVMWRCWLVRAGGELVVAFLGEHQGDTKTQIYAYSRR